MILIFLIQTTHNYKEKYMIMTEKEMDEQLELYQNMQEMQKIIENQKTTETIKEI